MTELKTVFAYKHVFLCSTAICCLESKSANSMAMHPLERQRRRLSDWKVRLCFRFEFLLYCNCSSRKKSHCWSSQFKVSIFPTELEVLWVISDPPPILKPTVSNSELKTQNTNNRDDRKVRVPWGYHGALLCLHLEWNSHS